MEANIKKEKITIKDLLGHKKYIMVLFARFISRFGDSIDTVAYSLMVYHLTGSKLLLGTLYIVNCIPSIIFSPFAGVLADRVSKIKGIVICDIGRGVMVSLTAFLLLTNRLLPWHLYMFTFMNSTFESFARPAKMSLIPFLLPKKLFLSASSISQSISSFAEIAGLGIAGFIIALAGFSGAIFIDGLTFFISAFTIFNIKIKEETTDNKSLNVKSYFIELIEGFKVMKEIPVVLIAVLLFSFINFCLTPFNVLLPAYATDILHIGPKGYSIMNLAFPIGVILGGVITAQVGSKFKKGYLISFGMSLLGVCYALFSLPALINFTLISPLLFATIIFFMFGMIMPITTSPLSAYMLSKVPREKIGRISALLGMLTSAAMPLGGGLSGALSEAIKMEHLFLIMGVSIMIASLLPLLNINFRNE